MLTQERLKESVHYDPETGQFTWKTGARAGEVAGTVHDHRGHLKLCIDYERHLLHRLAVLYMTGRMPTGPVYHADRNPSNNAWSNLRSSDVASEAQSRSARASRPSPRKGAVYARGDRWQAMSRDPRTGRYTDLGLFETIEEAHAAYCDADRRRKDDGAKAACTETGEAA